MKFRYSQPAMLTTLRLPTLHRTTSRLHCRIHQLYLVGTGKGVKMEASIKENNIKREHVLLPRSVPQLTEDFLRMLQCASKFGDDLHMHAHKEMVSWSH